MTQCLVARTSKSLSLVPSPVVSPCVTAGKLVNISVSLVPGRDNTTCSSAGPARVVINTAIIYWLKSSCIPLQQAKPTCWCPAPKRALYRGEVLYPVFSCPDRRNLPKQGGPAQSIPCLWALRWYCSVGDGVGAKPRSRAGPAQGTGAARGPLLVSPLLRAAGALGTAGPWGWDAALRALWVSLPCDSEAKIGSRQKDKRSTHYGATVWMFINVQPQRRHLQCLQGWPVSSVWFPILLSAIITGLQSSGPVAQNTLKFLHRGPMHRTDCQEFGEVWDETQANITVYLCLEYAGHPVSSRRLGQIWFVRQQMGRPLVCRRLVQDCVLEGLALPEAPTDCSEMLLNI